jgi:hypothetical protein
VAFRLNRIILQSKPGKIEYPDGSVLNFRYRPMAYTPNHEDLVELANEEGKSGSTLKAMLVPLIEGWDVVNEVQKVEIVDGEKVKVVDPVTGEPVFEYIPVPIDDEGLGQVPLRVLGDIMRKITEDMTPGEASDTSSEGSLS